MEKEPQNIEAIKTDSDPEVEGNMEQVNIDNNETNDEGGHSESNEE